MMLQPQQISQIEEIEMVQILFYLISINKNDNFKDAYQLAN
jgi:hypothetical protein